MSKRSSGRRSGGGRRGRWSLEGDRRIDVERDAGGVPHVRATSEPDLLRGLGNCHATDRGLQLVLSRIVARGRAAEVLSASDEMVELDRFFRRIDFANGAERELSKLSSRHRELLDAYVEGVNSALGRRRPWELRVLRHRPEPWTAEDSLMMARMVTYLGLAQTQGELEGWIVEMVQEGVPRALLDELFPGRLEDLDEELVRSARIENRVVPSRVPWRVAVPAPTASNNWAIAPARTASGTALLANDPHVPVDRLPAVWCETVLELEDRWIGGAAMPGLPLTAVGRNNDVAWGATYAYGDATDSWVEECRDGAALRIVDGEEHWEPFEVRKEVIRRRGKPPVEVTFHESSHGVLDGDPSSPGRYLATRWAGSSDTGAASFATGLDLLHAQSTSEVGTLLSRVEWSLNWVIADRHGSIGYRMSGRIPKRPEGHGGMVPLPGWDPACDWEGFVDPDDLPQQTDPPEGFVYTANHDLNDLGRADPINASGPPYRAERIEQRLSEHAEWSPEDAARLQMDVHSGHALLYMDVLRPLVADDPRFERVLAWDGSYADDSHETSWFEAFYTGLVVRVLGSRCGEESVRHILDETELPAHYFHFFDGVLLDPDSGWFGDGGRDAAFRAAAEDALPALAEPWGTRHQIVMSHPLLAKLPGWLGFSHGPITLRGGRATVHQGQLMRVHDRAVAVGPSYRFIADLGTAGAQTSLPGGPSDRRFSPWYTSGVDDWHEGRLKALGPNGGPRAS